MSKTKIAGGTLTAAEVGGAGAAPIIETPEMAFDRLVGAGETKAAELIVEAEAKAAKIVEEGTKKVQEIATIGANEATKIIEDAKAQAEDIVSEADKKADLTDDEIADAENDAEVIIGQAKTKAAKIIADAEGNAEAIKSEKARLAEVKTKAEDAEAAAKKRGADKAKRSKAKQKALTKPQVINEDDMRAALGVAALLGDMPSDLSALQAKLVQDHKAEFCDLLPQHTVKIYGMIAAGPAGFRQALKNWAAAVRRLAAQQAAT